MTTFTGFPDGRLRTTAVPNLFFSDLLPEIEHVGELKVTLYAFWALTQQDRAVRYLRLADFMQDKVLMDGLGPTATIAADNLLQGIERAVARGTFLQVTVESADGATELYFMNTQRGRAAVEGIERGEWRPALGRNETPVSLLVERPNIFVLYEQNIGALTPILADELRDTEQTFPLQWIQEAIEIAVKNNVRKWRYVRSILDDWQRNGKDSGTNRGHLQKKRDADIPDDLKDIIER